MAGASLLDRVLDDVLDATRSGRSVLVQAAVQGHDDVLRCILHGASNKQLTAGPDQAGFTKELEAAFLGAAEQGHVSCLSAIEESGHDMNDLTTARTEGGATALLLAARKGHAACVTHLLQHHPDAQVAAADSTGDTALISAARNGHAACVAQLLQHNAEAQVAAADSAGDTALMAAASDGHAACIQQLMQHTPEAQVVAADTRGNTALILAAWNGHVECIQQLLQHNPGAQVVATNDDGTTALMSAAHAGNAACVHQLLQHNPAAQVAAADTVNGDTALLAAAFYGHAECIQQLLQHSPEAQLAATNSNDATALVLAAGQGHPQCLDLLLTLGSQCDHNIQQKDLDSASSSALSKWNPTDARTSRAYSQCLARLLAKGARLQRGASAADSAKQDLLIQDLASRAVVVDSANEAIVGLALTVSKKRKAGQEEEQ